MQLILFYRKKIDTENTRLSSNFLFPSSLFASEEEATSFFSFLVVFSLPDSSTYQVYVMYTNLTSCSSTVFPSSDSFLPDSLSLIAVIPVHFLARLAVTIGALKWVKMSKKTCWLRREWQEIRKVPKMTDVIFFSYYFMREDALNKWVVRIPVKKRRRR